MTTEELQIKRILLSKEVANILSKGYCVITVLKLLNDEASKEYPNLNFTHSFRITRKNIWSFIRENNILDRIVITQKVKIDTNYSIPKLKDIAMSASLLKLKIMLPSSKVLQNYDPSSISFEDIKTKNLLKICNREYARRLVLNPVSALYEMSRKFNFNIKWKFEYDDDEKGWRCLCTVYAPPGRYVSTTLRNEQNVCSAPKGRGSKGPARRDDNIIVGMSTSGLVKSKKKEAQKIAAKIILQENYF
jgi:hypothetical protein